MKNVPQVMEYLGQLFGRFSLIPTKKGKSFSALSDLPKVKWSMVPAESLVKPLHVLSRSLVFFWFWACCIDIAKKIYNLQDPKKFPKSPLIQSLPKSIFFYSIFTHPLLLLPAQTLTLKISDFLIPTGTWVVSPMRS